MWLSQLLVLSFGVITNSVLLVKALPYCRKQNQTDEPHFTQELGHVDNVRLSHEIAILCCAEGYDRIRWFRLESSEWKSFPPPPDGDDDTPTLEEDGQILRIHDAMLTDQTTYRCDVERRTKVIQHSTYLNVIECDPMARGPMPTIPSPENKTIYDYGGNLTFHCTGYFGCQDKGDWSLQLAFWWADGKYVQNLDKRYEVVILENRNQFTKQAKFTITDVREEDTRRTFDCILQNPQEVHGHTKIAVKITKKDKPKIPWLMIGLIIGGLVILILIIIWARCLYGPQIKLFCISRISACGPKTIDKETYQYNVFIYHAEEDETVAQNIKRKLTDFNLEVFITADMGGNQIVMQTVFVKCRQSALVLLLYSEALRKDDMANFYILSLITERKGKGIIILEMAPTKPNEATGHVIQAENTNELHAENIIVAQNEMEIDRNENADTEHDTNKSITENDGVDGAENVVVDRVSVETENKFEENWKVLPRLKYPDDSKNKRKVKNFWCSLQNKIPKFDFQRQSSKKKPHNIDRANSINKPLLESCRDSEPLTPYSQSGSQDQVSPNTDEVFMFGSLDENENANQPDERLSSLRTGTVVKDVSASSLANNLRTLDTVMARAEIPDDSVTERGPELVCAADVHHAENSNIQEYNESRLTSPKTVLKNNNVYVEEGIENKPKVISREEIFTMSDEEPKPGSFESESGYSEETRSGRVTDHASESCENSRHELLSYKSSSGVSDLNSEESRSPENQVYPTHTVISDCAASGYTEIPEPVTSFETTNLPAKNSNAFFDKEKSEYVKKKTNDKLSLIIKPGDITISSSGTPESGYTSERTISTGGFPRKIEGSIDVIAEEL